MPICPICSTEIPVQRKDLPHDWDDNGARLHTKAFDVLIAHRFAKDPLLELCPGTGAIFEVS